MPAGCIFLLWKVIPAFWNEYTFPANTSYMELIQLDNQQLEQFWINLPEFVKEKLIQG